jgi:hypothetical protein
MSVADIFPRRRLSLARKPIIKTAVLKALETFKEGLVFSKLSKVVKEILGRSVYDAALNSAIKSLIKDGSVKKKFIHDEIVYFLSRQFHKQTVKDFLTSLTENFNLEELEANFTLDKARLPNLVYLSPFPMDEHEVSEKSNFGLSVSVDWSDPSQAISSVISNDYLLLPSDIQKGIANLILWGYWTSLQQKKVDCKVGEMDFPAQIKNLQRSKTYSTEILKSAKDSDLDQRVKTEKSIIDILDVTIELLEKQNLFDFLNYASNKRDYIEKCENVILSTQGHFMNSGERVFHNMIFEKSDGVFDGLQTIEDKAGLSNGLKSIFKETNLSMDTRVWNGFIDFLIELYPSDFMKGIYGPFEKAIERGKLYATYSNDLITLFEKRRMVVIYLWNIPIKKESEKYSKLPEFEEWYNALTSGELSHRIWLFEEETIKDVESAFRSVRKNNAPKPWRIDKELWTLKDLFDLHPKGKDPEFWRMLVNTLKAQRGKDPYRGGPVPKNVYYGFIRKERDAVKELIQKDKERN